MPCLILLLTVCVVRLVHCRTTPYPDTPDIQFLTASLGPGTILLKWDSRLEQREISYRSDGSETWIPLSDQLPQDPAVLLYRFKRPDVCTDYHFRLRGRIRGHQSTVLVERRVPAHYAAPDDVVAIEPAIVDNFYSFKDDTAVVQLSARLRRANSASAFDFPIDAVDLYPDIHVTKCFHSGAAQLPNITRVRSDGHLALFQIKFQAKFFEFAIRSGASCEISFMLEPRFSICRQPDTSVPATLIDNMVQFRLSCDATRDLPCSDQAKEAKLPAPNCFPSIIQSRLVDSHQVRLQWHFSERPTAAQRSPFGVPDSQHNPSSNSPRPRPIKYMIRYGEVDESRSLRLPNFKLLPIGRELGLVETGPGTVEVTVPVNKDDSKEYRVSVCAVYSRYKEKIEWDIVETHPLFPVSQSDSDVQTIDEEIPFSANPKPPRERPAAETRVSPRTHLPSREDSDLQNSLNLRVLTPRSIPTNTRRPPTGTQRHGHTATQPDYGVRRDDSNSQEDHSRASHHPPNEADYPPTRAVPPCSPNGVQSQFNWRPVAITIGLFTVANLVLLGMSCYLYSQARQAKTLELSHSFITPKTSRSMSK